MKDYVDSMIANMPDDMMGQASTPAAQHLFMVNNKNPVCLNKEKADIFTI